jgi:hypothetical protein
MKPRPHNKETEEKYLLIGECYVNELMYGEAIRAIAGDEEFASPVPIGTIIAKILEGTNKPKTIKHSSLFLDMEKREKKKARVDDSRLFTPLMLRSSS